MNELEAFDAMAGALTERSLITPDQVAIDRAAVMARMGLAPADANTTKPAAQGQEPPALSPEAQIEADELDTLAFQGPASPAAYNFGPAPHGVSVSLAQEASFRELFHTHEIPPVIGSEIGRLWNQACANPPNEARLEQGRQDCSVALHRLWGASTQQNLAVAQSEVRRMAKSNPGIIGMLEASGLGNSPWLVSTLFNLAAARGRVQ